MPDQSPRTSAPGTPRGRRIGLFGGSFDPVHVGHEHVARAAQAAFGLERVLWIPAARPPHKPQRILAEASDRVRMLELALEGEPAWSVETLELARVGPSYTIDTVRELARRLALGAEDRLFLLIGGDNLAGLPTWREASALLDLVEPVVVHREGDERASIEPLRATLAPPLIEKLERGLLSLPPVVVSSSDVRAKLERGEDVDAALSPKVAAYVRARNLYGARSPR